MNRNDCPPLDPVSTPSIPLKNRHGEIVAYTYVDPEDYADLSRYTWRLDSSGYAARSETVGGRKRTIRMHRVVNNTPKGCYTDHLCGNKLDNRRANLRTVTPGQNNANARDRKRKSRFRGVYWHNRASKWVAQISIGGKLNHLGLFEKEGDAARAYRAAARQRYSSFPRPNAHKSLSPGPNRL